MQFWDNNDNDEDRNSGNSNRPPQLPPNWRKWVSPGLLVLVMLLALISSPGLLGGFTSTPEIAWSDFFEQLRLNNVETFSYQDTTAVAGRMRSSIYIPTVTGRSQSVSRFIANIPGFRRSRDRRIAAEEWHQTRQPRLPYHVALARYHSQLLAAGIHHRILRLDGTASTGSDEWHIFLRPIPGTGENAGNAGDPV